MIKTTSSLYICSIFDSVTIFDGTMTHLLNILFCLCCCILGLNAEDLVVKLPVGSVRGRLRYTVPGTPFYSFQGIPYAEPPVNELRFLAPVPKKSWTGILDGTKEKNSCYQLNTDTSPRAEDCLFINVFTPQNPNKNASLPVMFFIYGGGFIEGYSTEQNYGPHHLMEKEVILVTFNYRIGAFGFLSTGDKVIPGNSGLKDQHLALEWTNKYIKYFGGDPKRITIFGQSAGGASVSYHMLSPKSKGLFYAAISESASALSPWAYQRRQVEISYELVKNVDYSQFNKINGSSKALLKYLQSVPSEQLFSASKTLVNTYLPYPWYNQIQQGFFFAPVIEVEHEGAFLTKRMYDSVEKGVSNNVPWIVGVATQECNFYNNPGFVSTAAGFDGNHQLLLPEDMHLKAEDRATVAEKIKNYYSPNKKFTEDITTLISYLSDQCFARSIVKTAQLQAKYDKVYFYQWSYLGVLGNNVKQSVAGFSNETRHGEELSYIFARNYGGYNTTDLSKYPAMDVKVLRRFITMVTNFAKYRNPTPQKTQLLQNLIWPQVDSNFQYIDIGSSLAVRKFPKWDMFEMWEKLYSEYAVKPYDTY